MSMSERRYTYAELEQAAGDDGGALLFIGQLKNATFPPGSWTPGDWGWAPGDRGVTADDIRSFAMAITSIPAAESLLDKLRGKDAPVPPGKIRAQLALIRDDGMTSASTWSFADDLLPAGHLFGVEEAIAAGILRRLYAGLKEIPREERFEHGKTYRDADGEYWQYREMPAWITAAVKPSQARGTWCGFGRHAAFAVPKRPLTPAP